MESILERKYGPAVNWTISEANEPRPVALHVMLHKREYVFPWARYIYANGANDHVLIAFPTHEVVIAGYGLDHLLADLAAQRVKCLREASRSDKFRAANEPEPKGAITELAVREIEE
jgi:hypothetical protein